MHDALEPLLRGAVEHAQADQRITLIEMLDYLWKEVDDRGRNRCDRDLPALALTDPADRQQRGIEFVEESPRHRLKPAAGGRGRDLACRSFEQRSAEPRFEGLDAARERRLGQVQ